MKKLLIFALFIFTQSSIMFAQDAETCMSPHYNFGSAPFADGQIAFSVPFDDNGHVIPQVGIFDPQSGNLRRVTNPEREEYPGTLVLSHNRMAVAFNAQGNNSGGQTLRVVYGDGSPTQDYLLSGSINGIRWTPDDSGIIVSHSVGGEQVYEGYFNYTLVRLSDGFQNQLLYVDLTGQVDARLTNSYSFGDVNIAHNSLVYGVHDTGILHLYEVSLTTGETTLMQDIPLSEEYHVGRIQLSPDGSIVSWYYSVSSDLVIETNMMFFNTITHRVTMFPDLFSFGGDWLDSTLIFGTFSEKNGEGIFVTIDFSETQPGLVEHPVVRDQVAYYGINFNWIDNHTIQVVDDSIFNIDITSGSKQDLLAGQCIPLIGSNQ